MDTGCHRERPRILYRDKTCECSAAAGPAVRDIRDIKVTRVSYDRDTDRHCFGKLLETRMNCRYAYLEKRTPIRALSYLWSQL